MPMVGQNSSARTLLVRLLQQSLMTKGSVAIALGVGVDEITRYERGETRMTLNASARLADVAIAVSRSHLTTQRRALALRSQIAATRAYEAGGMARVSNPPTLPWWRPR
jgi:hypothetical protein